MCHCEDPSAHQYCSKGCNWGVHPQAEVSAATSRNYFCTTHLIDGSYTDVQRKLQPAPSSQQAETTTSCLQRKSHLRGEGRGRVALNIT